MQVGQLDRVVIDDANMTDARRREVQQRRTTEPARSDDQHARPA